MPPMYINAGAWVDDGALIDSHALVGSCAQVGKRVHLSAAAQLGGVLEPVGALPVIVEDDVLVGGNCGVYEGTVVKRRAVLGAGVILTRSTPVYDLVRETIHRAEEGGPLVIPEEAVVVAGRRSRDPGQREGVGGILVYPGDCEVPGCFNGRAGACWRSGCADASQSRQRMTSSPIVRGRLAKTGTAVGLAASPWFSWTAHSMVSSSRP